MIMQMVAPKLVAEDSANKFLQHSSSSDHSSPTESLSSTATAAEAETLQGPFPPSASSFPEAELQQSPLLRISNAEGPQQIEQELELQGLPSPQPPRVIIALSNDSLPLPLSTWLRLELAPTELPEQIALHGSLPYLHT